MLHIKILSKTKQDLEKSLYIPTSLYVINYENFYQFFLLIKKKIF